MIRILMGVEEIVSEGTKQHWRWLVEVGGCITDIFFQLVTHIFNLDYYYILFTLDQAYMSWLLVIGYLIFLFYSITAAVVGIVHK